MKPQTFRLNQASVAAQIALVEGNAMIAGVDPLTGKRYALAITRFYVDRTVLPDGWPLDLETEE